MVTKCKHNVQREQKNVRKRSGRRSRRNKNKNVERTAEGRMGPE